MFKIKSRQLGLILASSFILSACSGPDSQPNTVQSGTISAAKKNTSISSLNQRKQNAPPAIDPGNPDTSARGGKTLLAIYLLGSDLETRAKAGSNDLQEMTVAYQKMTPQERDNIDVVVAFGGSSKTNWKGTKYTDLACIAQDAEDGQFGNDTCYAQQDPDVNMGAPETLSAFLEFLKANYPAANYGKQILDLWDHGSAHNGYGPDENFANGVMSLPDLNKALAAKETKFNLIGFDACLMANLVVARHVQEHANFLIASEELEPGHGWQYQDILSWIAAHPEASVVETGKQMVDSFVTHPDHQKQPGKTLSLLNLNQYDDVVQKLNELGQQLDSQLEQNYAKILEATSKAQGFGKGSKGKPPVAVDASHFISRLQSRLGTGDALSQSLSKMVMYSRTDGTRPDSRGVAMYPLNNTTDYQRSAYRGISAESPEWFKFVSTFLEQGLNDSLAPEVTQAPLDTPTSFSPDQDNNNLFIGESGFATQGFSLQQNQSLCQDGGCFEVKDNLGVEVINGVRATQISDDTIRILQELPAVEVAENIYRAPRWDGSVLQLCGTLDCEDGQRALVPLAFDDFTADDNLLYTADGVLNDIEVVFYFELDKDNEIMDIWAVPFNEEEEEDGESFTLISREQFEIEDNDELAFYYQEINIKTDEETYPLSPTIRLGPDAGFEDLIPDGSLFSFVLAEDLKGNISLSDEINLDI